MAAPLKISARVEIDASAAKQGAAASVSAVDSIGTAAERNTTKLQALINASVGLKSGAANQNVREWTGALAMQGRSIDELRAKYNPLFATISQYKTALSEIRTLHAQGVLSTNEMTAAIQRQRQAALASIDAIKGRASVIHGGINGEAGFRRQNLGYQLFDIGQGVSAGMPAGMIAAQQLPQIAQIYAGQGGGIKALLSDVGSLATGAVSAIGAMPLALAAAGTAALLYDRNVSSAAAQAQKALVKHEEALERIKTLFDESGSASERFGQRVQSAISFTARSDNRSLEDALARQTAAAGTELLNAVPRGSGAAMANLYGPYLSAVQHFIAEARQGRGDVAAFNEEVIRIGNANQADAKVQRIGQKLLDTTKAATDTATAIKKLNDELSRTTMSTARTDAALTMAQYRIANADALAAIRRGSSAELAGIGARSPAELAEAARARVRAEPVDPRESVEVRTARENAAAALAQAQAERQLSDARQERSRSLDQTLSQQQLELSLIGKTVGEQERLRMAFRLTSELKAEAARNNMQVDAAELAHVQKLSAEYGRLAEQMAASRLLADLQFEREQLSRSPSDQRIASQLRGAGLPVDLKSYEAGIMRANEALRKQVSAWEEVRNAGRSAIDDITESSLDGFKGIEDTLANIGKGLAKQLLQLGIANPLKNAIYGDQLPTISDVGGVGGFFSKLFGGGMSTASMSVQAATVSVNGGLAGGVGSLLGANDNFKPNTTLSALLGYGGAANDNAFSGILKAAGVTKTGIPLSEVTAARGLSAKVASEFAPRFQGLLNDLKTAGYNITSLGEGGYSFRNVAGTSKLSRHAFGEAIDINPRQNPWSHQFQTDLPSNINEIARRNGLTWGGTWNKPDTMHFQVDHASKALEKLSSTTDIAASGLGSLGTGLDKFGNALSSAQLGAGGTGGGGLLGGLGKLFGGISSTSSLWAPNTTLGSFLTRGYRVGGPTGGDDPDRIAGVVHEKEFVFDAASTARIGVANLEGLRRGVMRGFRAGGYVTVAQAYPSPTARGQDRDGAPAMGGFSQTIINNTGQPIHTEERADGRGGQQQVMIVGDMVAQAMSQPGNAANRALAARGAVKPMVRR